MIEKIKRRLTRLEKLLVPPDNWQILIERADGSQATMTAQEYRREKRLDPLNVHVVDMHVSGNAKELKNYLDMVRETAIFYTENDIDDSMII